MEDKKILLLLWNRADSAIAALQQAYGKLIYRIAFNIVGIHQDAQECENDTYLAIWNAIPPQKPEPLCPYVCRTGRNIALKRLRLETARKRCSCYDLSLEELCWVIPDDRTEQELSARALGRAIDAFLSGQKPENRILFLRRYWYGDSVQDAAAHLGISANTASVRLHRLRTELKEYLEKEALLCEE